MSTVTDKSFEARYQPLTAPEQRLLQQLAIFAGGGTLAAVEAVDTDDEPTPHPVRATLAALVAQGLVVATQPEGAEASARRYQLPEPVRRFALEKLEAAGGKARAQQRHRDFFLALAERYRPTMSSEAWERWHPIAQAEHENFRLAMEWSFEDEASADAAPRLVSLLMDGWSNHTDELKLYLRAIAWGESHPQISTGLFVRVLGNAARYAALNEPHTARRWSWRAVEVARAVAPDDKGPLLDALCDLAENIMLDLNDIDNQVSQARAVVAEMEAVYEEIGPEHCKAWPEAENQAFLAAIRAQLALLTGDYPQAKRHADERLRLFEALGPTRRFDQERAHLLVGQTCFYLEDYAAARQHILQATGMDDDTRDFISGTAYTHRWLAYIDLRLGELERAQQYCQGSLQQALKMPDYNVVASCFGLLACLAAAQGQAPRAAQLSGAAQALYARQGRNPWEDSSLDTLLPGWQTGPEQAALAQAYAAGQTMSVEAAVAVASATNTLGETS